MSEAPNDKDQEKGDEVLRRLLKTPPDPKTGKDDSKRKVRKSDERQATDRYKE